jgi:hypothetical protein
MTNSISFEKKIKAEKRRRNQLHNSLEYFLSNFSYFDFFSQDTFLLSQHLKFLVFENPKIVKSSEILFLLFFDSKNQISFLLKNFGFDEKLFTQIFLKNFEISKFRKIKNSLISPFSAKIKNTEIFSPEIQFIFQKASENALRRFKTPIVTLEILLITLMETKNTKAYKVLKKIIDNEADWYLLRYELIKSIHHHESSIRGEISINQQYFAYLLKTQISDAEFTTLIESESFPETVFLFRNTLISHVLSQDFFEEYLLDTVKGMEIKKIRQYSA